ncbi:MAG TPA: SDR family NAD(P)-dependent oxidoreductase, partial [Yinghuangia sp.]|nr:SDR family NAD(P)-dependent oxidoreductase [Yinghuangia sp.]
MQLDLTGRTALVTGSSQGIGLAIASGLARSGARVVVNGRDQGKVDAAVEEVRDRGAAADVLGIAADLASDEGTAEVVGRIPDIDILVNNLGIFGAEEPLGISDDEWRRYFEVNVLTAVRLTRTYLPGMTERGWGRVQYIASDSAVAIPAEMIH